MCYLYRAGLLIVRFGRRGRAYGVLSVEPSVDNCSFDRSVVERDFGCRNWRRRDHVCVERPSDELSSSELKVDRLVSLSVVARH